MAVENRGILIKMTGDGALIWTACFDDFSQTPPVRTVDGEVRVRIMHLAPLGAAWELYNFVNSAFEVPTDGTSSAYYTAATHQAFGSVTPWGSGLWSYRHTYLDPFEMGHQYIIDFEHIGDPVEDGMGPRHAWCQYGAPPIEGTWNEEGVYPVNLILTLEDGVTPCPNVYCLAYTPQRVKALNERFDINGVLHPSLNAGIYSVSFGPDSRYAFGEQPKIMVVTAADQTFSFTCTEVIYPDQGMTFGQLKGHVQDALADYASTAAGIRSITPADAGIWVNQALYQLDSDLRWNRQRETINGVLGTRHYDLDADVREILTVAWNGTLLQRLTSEQEIAQHDANDGQDTPGYWSLWGSELSLYPTPKASVAAGIQLLTVRTPLALVSDETIPTLPAHTHRLLVDYALHQAYIRVGNAEMALVCMNAYLVGAQREASKLAGQLGLNVTVRQAIT